MKSVSFIQKQLKRNYQQNRHTQRILNTTRMHMKKETEVFMTKYRHQVLQPIILCAISKYF